MRAVRNRLPRFSLSGINKKKMSYFYSTAVVVILISLYFELRKRKSTSLRWPRRSYRARLYRARPYQDKLWKSWFLKFNTGIDYVDSAKFAIVDNSLFSYRKVFNVFVWPREHIDLIWPREHNDFTLNRLMTRIFYLT